MFEIYINIRGKQTGNITGLVAVLHKDTQERVRCEAHEIGKWAQEIVDGYEGNE